MENNNILGIDWGEKEIGIAVASAETRLALALSILENNAALWKHLEKIIEEQEVGSIIVGVPRYQEKTTMNRAEQFAAEIGQHFPALKIILANEMFTSKMAAEKLRETGGKEKKDHAEAARITLEDWLESRGESAL